MHTHRKWFHAFAAAAVAIALFRLIRNDLHGFEGKPKITITKIQYILHIVFSDDKMKMAKCINMSHYTRPLCAVGQSPLLSYAQHKWKTFGQEKKIDHFHRDSNIPRMELNFAHFYVVHGTRHTRSFSLHAPKSNTIFVRRFSRISAYNFSWNFLQCSQLLRLHIGFIAKIWNLTKNCRSRIESSNYNIWLQCERAAAAAAKEKKLQNCICVACEFGFLFCFVSFILIRYRKLYTHTYEHTHQASQIAEILMSLCVCVALRSLCIA